MYKHPEGLDGRTQKNARMYIRDGPHGPSMMLATSLAWLNGAKYMGLHYCGEVIGLAGSLVSCIIIYMLPAKQFP